MKERKVLFNFTSLMIAVLGMLFMFVQTSAASDALVASCQVCHTTIYDPPGAIHSNANHTECKKPQPPSEHSKTPVQIAVIHSRPSGLKFSRPKLAATRCFERTSSTTSNSTCSTGSRQSSVHSTRAGIS